MVSRFSSITPLLKPGRPSGGGSPTRDLGFSLRYCQKVCLREGWGKSTIIKYLIKIRNSLKNKGKLDAKGTNCDASVTYNSGSCYKFYFL